MEAILGIFSSPIWLTMFEKVETYSAHLKILTTAVLKSSPGAKKAVDSLQQRDSEQQIQPEDFNMLHLALGRLEKLFRFIGAAMGLQPKFLAADEPLGSADMVYLMGYKGKDYPERAILDAIHASQFWTRECDECIRCATSSISARPIMERLTQTLTSWKAGELEMTPDRLEDMVSHLPTVRKGLRRVDLQDMDELACKFLATTVNDILAGKILQRSRHVQNLQKALKIYGKTGGFHDLHERLQDWLTKNQKVIALLDLLDLAQVSEKQGGSAQVQDVQDSDSNWKKIYAKYAATTKILDLDLDLDDD